MNQVSVSNIAWPAGSDDQALDLAIALGFDGIEIAPTKLFAGLDRASFERARGYRARLAAKGLAVPALQAIMYGAAQCELFGSDSTRRALRSHLARIAELANILGAHACVFGAPKLRDPGDLDEAQALAVAADFFADTAPLFADAGTCLAFEANAVQYNCRFITRTLDAVALVQRIDHPGVRVQLDTGTIFSMDEPPSVAHDAAPFAVHFHASEPGLAPLGATGADHSAVASALATSDYRGWVSVEMAETPAWQDNLRGAAQLIAQTYRA